MTVYVFGNPDLAQDALPVRLVPELRKQLPGLTFEVKDPNEEWDVPEHLIVIDTVVGIDRVQRFDSLEPFSQSPRVSMHDFDALTQLRLLQILGKLHQVTIIGVPPKMDKANAVVSISALLKTLATSSSNPLNNLAR